MCKKGIIKQEREEIYALYFYDKKKNIYEWKLLKVKKKSVWGVVLTLLEIPSKVLLEQKDVWGMQILKEMQKRSLMW